MTEADRESVVLEGGPCSGQTGYSARAGTIRTVYIELRGAMPKLKPVQYEVVEGEHVAVYLEENADC